MTTPATAAALLLLAVLSVCASARTVPQQDSVWTHLMRAWAPARPTQQQLAAPVSGYALYDEATGRFTFTHKEPNSGELCHQRSARVLCIQASLQSTAVLPYCKPLHCLLQGQHLPMPPTPIGATMAPALGSCG